MRTEVSGAMDICFMATDALFMFRVGGYALSSALASIFINSCK